MGVCVSSSSCPSLRDITLTPHYGGKRASSTGASGPALSGLHVNPQTKPGPLTSVLATEYWARPERCGGQPERGRFGGAGCALERRLMALSTASMVGIEQGTVWAWPLKSVAVDGVYAMYAP